MIYDDIYPVSCHDAAIVAETVGLRADDYIAGELDDAIDLLRAKNLDVDIVANNDVIEHIYDMGAFLRKLPRLSSGPMTVSLATGANSLNPRIRRKLERLHVHRERADRARRWGHKEGDSLRSYRSVRADIIRAHCPDLNPKAVERLADATRGMMKGDVEAAVDRYRATGAVPVPEHPTNTCDPETGSWAEHLMDVDWLRTLLGESGFRTRAVPGLYGVRNNPAKSFVANALDRAIARLDDRGVLLSPFLVLHGTTLPV